MKANIKTERTIHRILEKQVEKFGDKDFLYFKDETYSYLDFENAANKIASGLQKIGIKKGDKVAILLNNCPEYIFLWFALSKLGAIEVPINTAHKGDILTYMLDNSDSCLLVCDYAYMGRVQGVLSHLGKLGQLVLIDNDDHSTNEESLNLPVPMINWNTLIDNNGEYQRCDILWSDPYSIMYTSGTTGPSKGILLPQNYAVYLADVIKGLGEYTAKDCLYNALPLFHGNAQILSFLPALASGAKTVLAERFSAGGFWSDVKKMGCTEFNYIGSIIPILFKAEPKSNDADNPVRIMLGAAAPKEIFIEFEKRFGVELVEIYGSNEIALPLTSNRYDRKPGSLGKVRKEFELKLVDDEGFEVGPNTPGEILTRPIDPYNIQLEYYKMPEKTVEAWRDLWFHTGDYAYQDEEGYYFFIDRKKDALRRRGENISSYEVEKEINAHPAVLESAAIAIKSDLGEDEVMIYIVLKESQSLDFEALIKYCHKRMAYFMIPRYVRVVDALPKTSTQKIQKHILRDFGLTLDTWDRETAGIKLER